MKVPIMTRTFPRLMLAAGLALAALPAAADSLRVPRNAAFEEECGSCHLAFPPQLLDAASWRAVMAGLPKHFGTDASLDDKRRAAITDFLVAHAGRRDTRDAKGQPLLRATETRWFVHEHDEVANSVWSRPSIKSAANCAACHTQAAAGDYRERNIRIPR